jgi:hypothetical protein
MAKKQDKSYWENVIKEIGEFRRANASANFNEGQYQARNWKRDPKTLEELKAAERRNRYLKEEKDGALEEEKAERGQLLGAILQGRRYKKSGKQKKK